MSLPPGPLFLLRLALQNLPTSIALYGGSRLAVFYLGVATPVWLTIITALSAQLILLAVMSHWRAYRNRSDAVANGAVLVPQVQDSGLSTISAMVESLKSGYPGDVFQNWSEKYGQIYNLNIIFDDMLLTFEPEHIKAILATQFDKFEKGPVFISQFYAFLGTGVFNADGDMWRFHRGITRPFFSKERITDFDIFDRHASDAIGQVVDRLNAGFPIDFQARDVVSRFTIDSATEFLFGNDIRTLSAGLPYPASSPLADSDAFVNHPSNKFASAFMKGQYVANLRTRYGPAWPLVEFWKDKVKPHRKVVDQFIEPILVEALAKRTAIGSGVSADNKDGDGDDSEGVLLNHLINHTKDIEVLKDELVNLLVAGRDTTASTLAFGMYMLTQHPHVANRLREEILGNVGHSRPTFEQMKEMKYLRAFINETLRLYPPVPMDVRTSNQATVLPATTPGQKPFYIPANRRCVYSVFAMHRRTDLWGRDAHEFDPDRFIDERLAKYLVPNPFIFVPFNAGPRICLGQQFAYHEMSFFLIRLLQRFSAFTLAEDAQPADSQPPPEWSKCKGSKGTDKIWPGVHLTMYVKGGLWIRMEEAHRDD